MEDNTYYLPIHAGAPPRNNVRNASANGEYIDVAVDMNRNTGSLSELVGPRSPVIDLYPNSRSTSANIDSKVEHAAAPHDTHSRQFEEPRRPAPPKGVGVLKTIDNSIDSSAASGTGAGCADADAAAGEQKEKAPLMSPCTPIVPVRQTQRKLLHTIKKLVEHLELTKGDSHKQATRCYVYTLIILCQRCSIPGIDRLVEEQKDFIQLQFEAGPNLWKRIERIAYTVADQRYSSKRQPPTPKILQDIHMEYGPYFDTDEICYFWVLNFGNHSSTTYEELAKKLLNYLQIVYGAPQVPDFLQVLISVTTVPTKSSEVPPDDGKKLCSFSSLCQMVFAFGPLEVILKKAVCVCLRDGARVHWWIGPVSKAVVNQYLIEGREFVVRYGSNATWLVREDLETKTKITNDGKCKKYQLTVHAGRFGQTTIMQPSDIVVALHEAWNSNNFHHDKEYWSNILAGKTPHQLQDVINIHLAFLPKPIVSLIYEYASKPDILWQPDGCGVDARASNVINTQIEAVMDMIHEPELKANSNLKKLFCEFDKNDDGFLTAIALHTGLQENNIQCDFQAVVNVLEQIGCHDLRVTLDTFEKIMQLKSGFARELWHLVAGGNASDNESIVTSHYTDRKKKQILKTLADLQTQIFELESDLAIHLKIKNYFLCDSIQKGMKEKETIMDALQNKLGELDLVDKKFQQTFEEFDTNGDKCVDIVELREGLNKHGLGLDYNELVPVVHETCQYSDLRLDFFTFTKLIIEQDWSEIIPQELNTRHKKLMRLRKKRETKIKQLSKLFSSNKFDGCHVLQSEINRLTSQMEQIRI